MLQGTYAVFLYNNPEKKKGPAERALSLLNFIVQPAPGSMHRQCRCQCWVTTCVSDAGVFLPNFFLSHPVKR